MNVSYLSKNDYITNPIILFAATSKVPSRERIQSVHCCNAEVTWPAEFKRVTRHMATH